MEYFITAAGIPVHINESKKDGKAILLLHGYFETLYIWNEFQELISPEYRLISIDLPGHGLTGMPSDDFTPQFSNLFLNSILEKLSVNQCHIITHTCGFHLAAAFSQCHPEKVISIFNIGSPDSITQPETDFISSALNSVTEGTFFKFISLVIPRMYYSSNLRDCDEKIEETIEICETHEPEAIYAFLNGISSFFSSKDSGILNSVPCYNLTGQYDSFFFTIPLDFDIIPDCSSNSFIERPEEVYGRLENFLSRKSTTGNY